MALTKSAIRRFFIDKAMEKILNQKNEIFKVEHDGCQELLDVDTYGLAIARANTGRAPSFSAPAIDLGNDTFVSIDLEKLQDKDPKLFNTLLTKYPTEVKARYADTVSVTCTPKCYTLAADELGIGKEEFVVMQAKVKQYKKEGKIK